MNRWTSKKRLWPFLTALGCLFALAVAAPCVWQGCYSTSEALPEDVLDAEPEDAEPTDATSVQAVVVPEHGVWEPEYDVSESVRIIATPEYSAWEPVYDVAETAETTPSETQEPPVQEQFDLDTLQQMRDAVLGAVDRLSNQEQEQPSTTAPQQHRVQVGSEHDRLAMLDTAPRRDNDLRDSDLSNRAAEDNATQPSKADDSAEQRLAERTAPPTQQSIELPFQGPMIPPLIRHRPIVLYQQLEALIDVPSASTWSEQVVAQLRLLTEETPAGETTQKADVTAIIQQLRSLAEEGNDSALKVSHPAAQQDWLQAKQAIERRLEIWQVLLDPKQQDATPTDHSAHQSVLMPVMGEVAALLATETNGVAWHEYLLLDRIAATSSEGVEIDTKALNKLAREVLSCMSDRQLTEAQEKFLAMPPLLSLRQLLQSWASQSIDIDRLVALIERYETGRELRYAAAIASVQQQLQWSDDARYRALGEHLDQHYRSSNMRIAFSAELLNRMMPKQKATMTPVNDRIAGAKVRGKARTTTNLRVRLTPDPDSWRFSLKAFGKVTSNTQSDTWPAKVRNAAKMQYQVKKVIVIDQQGLRTSAAKASAEGRHDLVSVDSQLDPVPLVGHLLREIARNKNHKSRPFAMSQVKSKITQQAQQRMDQEANPKLDNLEQKFRDNVLAPIGQLALVAEPVTMATTSERAVMRLRLANDGQLGAHTPRPLAPSDSVISMQLHETAMNNALAGLELEGRRMKLPELFRFFAAKFGDPDAALPEDLPARAIIEFSGRDAILVNCDGDRLNFVFSIHELAHGRDKIKNFQVHAYFRPVLDGLAVRFVRDGTLQFSGQRLKTGPRIVLHSALGKLLPKDQEMRLLANELQEDPRLDGLMVTQLVIDDGWIGLALGPASDGRVAWRSLLLDSSTPFLR